MTPARFDDETLALLDAAPTVRIDTVDRHAPDGPPRSTIIWIMVDGDEVFVRSVRGARGRWYRDLMRDPRVTLRPHKGRWSPITVTAVVADAASIERCSRALERSYAGDPALGLMLRDDTLATTIRLVPA